MSHTPEVVKSGYLTKSPPEGAPLMSQWRRRWFVLCDSSRAYPLAERSLRMEYYQSEEEVKRLADPKGVVDLKNCLKVVNREPVKGHKFVFDVHTNNRVFHLAAETAVEKHEWVQTLNNLLFTKPSEPPIEVSEVSKKLDALDVSQQRVKPKLVRPFNSVDNVLRTPKPNKQAASRPVSYAGGLHNDGLFPSTRSQSDTVGIACRPLPGVPGQERKNWPLPPPPGQTRPISVMVPTTAGATVTQREPGQEEVYELAAAAEDEMSPGPYEEAVNINYEDVKIDDDDSVCQPETEDCNRPYEEVSNPSDYETAALQYEVPVKLLIKPASRNTQPLPPTPPPSVASKSMQPLPPLPSSTTISLSSSSNSLTSLKSQQPLPPTPPQPYKSLSQPSSSSSLSSKAVVHDHPVPLPRTRRNICVTNSGPMSEIREDYHGSLPDITEINDSILGTVNFGSSTDIESGDYGQITMMGSRRYSQPDIMNSRKSKSPLPTDSIPLSTDTTRTAVTASQRPYYENVGVSPPQPIVPPVVGRRRDRQDYSHLEF